MSDGAEIITFFAPAFICCKESFFEVKIPVHSITILILFFFHGNLSGFVSEIIWILPKPISKEFLSFLIFLLYVPWIESYLNKCIFDYKYRNLYINLCSKIWNNKRIHYNLIKINKENNKYFTIDVGTGAGFPGIVLATLGRKDLILCEKSKKKNLFLNYNLYIFYL